MPLKDKALHNAYDKGYYAGYRKATIQHLGGKCQICDTKNNLEIHHVNNLSRQKRSVKDLKDLSVLRVYCKEHHVEVDSQ